MSVGVVVPYLNEFEMIGKELLRFPNRKTLQLLPMIHYKISPSFVCKALMISINHNIAVNKFYQILRSSISRPREPSKDVDLLAILTAFSTLSRKAMSFSRPCK